VDLFSTLVTAERSDIPRLYTAREGVREVRFYNKRGTAEQWIKEGKQAVKMTRLSCHRFRSNEVRLWLSVLAYSRGVSGGGLCCRRRSRTGR